MNNTVENDFFDIPRYTGDVGKCTSYWCQIFSGFNIQKIIKIGYLKNKKVDVIFGTQCRRSLITLVLAAFSHDLVSKINYKITDTDD